MSGSGDRLRDEFEACFGGLAAIGQDPAGGWTRLAWTDEDRAARSWFEAEASARGLTVEQDPAGNLWAWWAGPGEAGEGGVVAVGSHLDTVRRGGAYDGALGVVSGLVAVGELIARGVEPERPVAVVAFADEEGGRFGVPTFGSRLLTGALDPPDVLGRADLDGVTVAEAMAAAGADPDQAGPDPARVGRLGAFVELHVEQGRGLADLGQPVGLGTGIWPHGRWRLTLTGEANHAGTTRLPDRRDPMLGLAAAVLAARAAATELDAVATVGRVEVEPNSANSVPARVSAWLDARAPQDRTLDWLVTAFQTAVEEAAGRNGLTAELDRRVPHPRGRLRRRPDRPPRGPPAIRRPRAPSPPHPRRPRRRRPGRRRPHGHAVRPQPDRHQPQPVRDRRPRRLPDRRPRPGRRDRGPRVPLTRRGAPHPHLPVPGPPASRP